MRYARFPSLFGKCMDALSYCLANDALSVLFLKLKNSIKHLYLLSDYILAD